MTSVLADVLWFVPRLAMSATTLYLCLCELGQLFLVESCTPQGLKGQQWLGQGAVCWLFRVTANARAPYLAVREASLAHPVLAIMAFSAIIVAALLIKRRWTVFWNNEVMARLRGTYLKVARYDFPNKRIDFDKALARRARECKPGDQFVGMQPLRKFGLWWSYKPVYLTAKQRSMHRHILGKTGSGKTMGLIWPSIVQDMRDGRGVFFMDAKGSDESLRMFIAEAKKAGREKDVRVICLPALNRTDLFSHTWSLTSVGKGGDPLVTADRLLSILQVGQEHQYYFGQAKLAVRALCRVLHGIDLGAFDDKARGQRLPFTVNDLVRLLLAAGADEGDKNFRLLKALLKHTKDQDAAERFRAQVSDLRAKGKAAETFSGLCAALDDFSSPLVNARKPDVVFEDVLEQGLLVYAQLPANLFPLQAKAFGRAMLKDLQQAASLRQVERKKRSQAPFAVYIDEFYNFADLTIIDGLNKLRDANIWYTLSHQSLADLNLVSPEFTQMVWDNTRNKDVLAQDNPELCERIAKSLGTFQEVHKTVRHAEGPYATSVATGDASAQLGETLKLHPNAIKNLKPVGQGFQFTAGDARPVVYPELAPPEGEVELVLNRNSQPEGDVLGRVGEAFARMEARRALTEATPTDAPRRARAAASVVTIDQARAERLRPRSDRSSRTFADRRENRDQRHLAHSTSQSNPPGNPGRRSK